MVVCLVHWMNCDRLKLSILLCFSNSS
uniref:Plant myosin MYS1 family protein n=1 Tax=Rhizophora mucronata TaxID=61149 RepID=A0A2P2MP72_RHIMU